MIENYRFGRITIDGRDYTGDVIVYPDRVDDEWWREEGHSLCMADLEDILDIGPDVLVIGTGANGLMAVPEDVRRELRARGIEPRPAPTAEACDLYNELAGESTVIAALHLTC